MMLKNFFLIFVTCAQICVMESYFPPPRIDPAYVPAMPRTSPNCVKGFLYSYCVEPDNYPEERIKELLAKQKFDMLTLFVNESTNTLGRRMSVEVSEQPNLNYQPSHKSGRQTNFDSITVADICPSSAGYVKPRSALMSSSDEWRFVINMNEKMTQYVKTEVCLSSSCDNSCDFPDGYTSYCQQEYAQKRLVSLDGMGQSLVTEVFWFPSHCACKIKIV
ncbi:UNVERIFIED_CONTAM: hypothetical protein RMT77_000477 [Armadillidium vulgare]